MDKIPAWKRDAATVDEVLKWFQELSAEGKGHYSVCTQYCTYPVKGHPPEVDDEKQAIDL